MSNRTSPNRLIQQRYGEGKRVIRESEGRELTQREFLDVAFGVNPKTGKPYNTRTLRKWLKGERDASQAVEHSKRDTYSFQQRVRIGDQEFAPNLTKPSRVSGLDLFTPAGRKRIKRAATARMNKRIDDNADSVQKLRSTRGLKLRTGRAVAHTKRPSVIITRRTRSPLRYTQAA